MLWIFSLVYCVQNQAKLNHVATLIHTAGVSHPKTKLMADRDRQLIFTTDNYLG